MANYDFKRDLAVAKKTEIEVAKFLEKVHGLEVVSFGTDSKYDILCKGTHGKLTFEVKEDFMCQFTGNVALEFESRGKNTGITSTKARYYVYKIHKKGGKSVFFVFKTTILKKMVKDKKYTRIVNGGDKGSNTMNYLFPYDVFVKFGKRIREKPAYWDLTDDPQCGIISKITEEVETKKE